MVPGKRCSAAEPSNSISQEFQDSTVTICFASLAASKVEPPEPYSSIELAFSYWALTYSLQISVKVILKLLNTFHSNVINPSIKTYYQNIIS
jgi:hypothetical protein